MFRHPGDLSASPIDPQKELNGAYLYSAIICYYALIGGKLRIIVAQRGAKVQKDRVPAVSARFHELRTLRKWSKEHLGRGHFVS